MNRVNEWFANVVAQLACLYADKGVIWEMKASEADMIEAAGRFGFFYFDCGDGFVLSRPKFCK